MDKIKELKVEESADALIIPSRIAFIKERVTAKVEKEEREVVMTFPNLVVKELIAFQVMIIVIAFISIIFDAKLEWIANPEHTPNPAKAPWYFLGLQELLHYFPPVVAGVILPGLVIVALIVIPYFKINYKQEGMWKKNAGNTFIIFISFLVVVSLILLMFHVYAMFIPTIVISIFMLIPLVSKKETGFVGWLATRPLKWWIMTWFVVIVVILTSIGTFFRGPEWSWSWPWKEIY